MRNTYLGEHYVGVGSEVLVVAPVGNRLEIPHDKMGSRLLPTLDIFVVSLSLHQLFIPKLIPILLNSDPPHFLGTDLTLKLLFLVVAIKRLLTKSSNIYELYC